VYLVAQLQGLHMLRHHAALGEPGVHVAEVDLDDQVQAPQVVVGTAQRRVSACASCSGLCSGHKLLRPASLPGGCVGPGHLCTLGVGVRDADVLPHGQSQHVLRRLMRSELPPAGTRAALRRARAPARRSGRGVCRVRRPPGVPGSAQPAGARECVPTPRPPRTERAFSPACSATGRRRRRPPSRRNSSGRKSTAASAANTGCDNSSARSISASQAHWLPTRLRGALKSPQMHRFFVWSAVPTPLLN
jgi:hypothetical protein